MLKDLIARAGGPSLDMGAMGGFDILSLPEGSNETFTLLTVGSEQPVYSIDLGIGGVPRRSPGAGAGLAGVGAGGAWGLVGPRRARRAG